jgi:putative thioredoxin
MAANPNRWVVDVGDADFDAAVLARSAETPVVVDFWAPWCAPCRVLGPVLERLATEHDGEFILAKVNVDEAPVTAARNRVQGIPAVKGFRDGMVVAEFTGLQPEDVLRRLLTAVLPTEADRLAQAGARAVAAGDEAAAEAEYRNALEHDARHARALVALARLLGDRDETAAALDLLDRVLPSAPQIDEVQRLAAELRTRADGAGDERALRARLAVDPADLQARLDLGRLLAARGAYEIALAELLDVVRREPHFADDAGRKAMLDIFTVLGNDHPLTDRFRGELAKALYR